MKFVQGAQLSGCLWKVVQLVILFSLISILAPYDIGWCMCLQSMMLYITHLLNIWLLETNLNSYTCNLQVRGILPSDINKVWMFMLQKYGDRVYLPHFEWLSTGNYWVSSLRRFNWYKVWLVDSIKKYTQMIEKYSQSREREYSLPRG